MNTVLSALPILLLIWAMIKRVAVSSHIALSAIAALVLHHAACIL